MNLVDWLLESDPSLRWQALRDLTGETEGQRSGCITPRAMRVLRWAARWDPTAAGAATS